MQEQVTGFVEPGYDQVLSAETTAASRLRNKLVAGNWRGGEPIGAASTPSRRPASKAPSPMTMSRHVEKP
jgi:hypothetical protein